MRVCCSEFTNDFRKLHKEVKQKEIHIKEILEGHRKKGLSTPVRIDQVGKALTPSKHGHMFDVNIEAVRREEKVHKVGGHCAISCVKHV